jgi:hypothetical protein
MDYKLIKFNIDEKIQKCETCSITPFNLPKNIYVKGIDPILSDLQKDNLEKIFSSPRTRFKFPKWLDSLIFDLPPELFERDNVD